MLALKGLDWRPVNYNGLLARKAAKLSPVGKLPVLDYEGERVQDSSRIAIFLEARRPKPSLFPKETRDRASAHFWEDWADESLYWYEVYFRFTYPEALQKSVDLLCEGRPAYERPLFKWIGAGALKRALKAQGLGRMQRVRIEADFAVHLEALEHVLEGRTWLVGSEPSIADLAVSAQLDEIVRTSHMKNKVLSYPNLAAWLRRSQPEALPDAHRK